MTKPPAVPETATNQANREMKSNPSGASPLHLWAGVLGLLGALLVGTGEFLLHFDSLARYAEDGRYLFMSDISVSRSNWGHFIAVLGIPLYIPGCWHLWCVTKTRHPVVAAVAATALGYGFFLGAVWIGSRASAHALTHHTTLEEVRPLIELYELRYETLLQGIRATTLVFSITFIGLVAMGRTSLPRWAAAFNPITSIALAFALYFAVPEVGKYIMPIALNVAFSMLFVVTLLTNSLPPKASHEV